MTKKWNNLPKILRHFIIWTLISSFAITIMKIVFVAHIFDNKDNLNDNYNRLLNMKKHNKLNTPELIAKFDFISEARKDNNVGVKTQLPILFISFIFYVVIFFKFYKYLFKEKTMTTKDTKMFIIETLVFLILFLIIDIFALKIMLFDLDIAITGWQLYSLITTTIAPLFLVVSLIWSIKMFKVSKLNKI